MRFINSGENLRRAIERFLVYPLSNLVATGQVGLGDMVHVDTDSNTGKLLFWKDPNGALISDVTEENLEAEEELAMSDGIGLEVPQPKVARRSQTRGEKLES